MGAPFRPAEHLPAGRGVGAAAGPRGQELRVRPAAPSDVGEIAAIERSAFSDPWSTAAFRVALGRPDVRVTVAEAADGSVAGYLVCWFVADEGEVANVAVHPDRRRSGAGAALLDDCLSAAATAGAGSVYLEVRESNVAARALYSSRGFAEVGRRRRYYAAPVEDALVLRWTAASASAGTDAQ